MSKKGFILIELLVVVLITGILAAIALPQYNAAVAKPRFTQLVLLASAIRSSEQIYLMQTGAYTDDLTALDIEPPFWGAYSSGNSVYKFGDFTLSVMLDPHNIVCASGTKILVTHCNYFAASGRDCRVSQGDALAAKICKSLGAKFNHAGSGNKDMYFGIDYRCCLNASNKTTPALVERFKDLTGPVMGIVNSFSL